MLNRLIALSLRNRLFVVVAALAVAAYGALVGAGLPVDVLPDLNRPTVTILTEVHGLVPEDVEQLVTRYIEQAVNGATGVSRVRSSSGVGLSVVYVEFDWDTDVYRNRQIIQEKLQLVGSQLPPGVSPQMAPISSIMGQIQVVGFRSRSGNTDATEIRAVIDRVVRPRLLSVSGVAQVVTTGGAPRQLQVVADADAMRALDVGLADIADAIGASNIAASGGFLDVGSKGPIVSVTGLVSGPDDLARAVVRDDPVRPIRLSDVARVEFGPSSVRVGDAGVNAGPGVILVIFKQPEVDTVDLSERVERELDDIALALPEDYEVLPAIYRQSDFINRAIDNVTEAVVDGSVFVVLILFVFLLNVRTTAITLTAIPLSIAATLIVFEAFGVSINTMTLGGLAVAIGALVDDAIVNVENVFRRLRQNRASSEPRSALVVVFRASAEVRRPILIGTLVVIAVYVPLFGLSGMEGRLFAPIGVAYIVSILASLVVSMTVTPVLCHDMLARSKAVEQSEGRAVRGLQHVAEKMIRFSLAHPKGIAAVTLAFVIGGGMILWTRGSEFLPPFNEGTAQINLILPPGTSLSTSNDFGRRLERLVVGVEGVAIAGRRTGRAEGDEHAEGVNVTEIIVSFDPESERTREQILAEIRERMAIEFPGVATAAEQPLAHLMSALLSGVTAQVAIKIRGENLATLRKTAKEVAGAIRGVDGVADLIVEPQVMVDRVRIEPLREELARRGLDVHDIAESVELALEGGEISRWIQGEVSYPIVLRLERDDRKDVPTIRNLLIRGENGRHVRLGDVASVGLSRTPNNINRENVSRRMVVQLNVQGRSLGEVATEIDHRLDAIRAGLPAGYSIEMSGQFEAQAEAARVVTVLSLVSLVVMLILVYLHFGSFNLAAQTLANLPMAFVGAVVLIIGTGQPVSIATLVGLISLGGIAARNKILLLDHYVHLMREEGESFSAAMIIRAGRERIVPVLMTALTTGVALIPLVLSPGEPGRELLYPVASVIVGGLVSTTLLDVLLTPGLFWLFGRAAVERCVARREMTDSDVETITARLDDRPLEV